MCNVYVIYSKGIVNTYILGIASIITVIMNLYRDLFAKHVSVLYHTYIMCFVMLGVYIYIYIYLFILYTHYHVISQPPQCLKAQVPPGALPGQVIQIAAPVTPVVVGAPMGAWETEAGNLPETLEAAEFGFKGFPT